MWAIQTPRDFVIDFFLNRWTWFWIALAALVVSLVVWWIRRPVNLTVLLALCAFVVLNAYSGWFNPGLMSRSQQWGARYVGFDMADRALEDSDEVVVVEINGDAVAYTKTFLENHPFVRTKIGGKEMIVAYDAEHDVATPFYADGYTGSSVDVFGSTDDGRTLRRVEGLLAKVYWMIWSHFEKDTDVNRE